MIVKEIGGSLKKAAFLLWLAGRLLFLYMREER